MDGRYAGDIETPIERRADPDLGQMMARLNGRTWLRAQDLADAGRPGALPVDVLRGVGRFLACYVWRQGLREGDVGFLISLMAGLEAIVAGMRARELVRARLAAAAAPAAPALPAQLASAFRR